MDRQDDEKQNDMEEEYADGGEAFLQQQCAAVAECERTCRPAIEHHPLLIEQQPALVQQQQPALIQQQAAASPDPTAAASPGPTTAASPYPQSTATATATATAPLHLHLHLPSDPHF